MISVQRDYDTYLVLVFSGRKQQLKYIKLTIIRTGESSIPNKQEQETRDQAPRRIFSMQNVENFIALLETTAVITTVLQYLSGAYVKNKRPTVFF